MNPLTELQRMHWYLFPERYPPRMHAHYEPGDDCYQWDSDTIEFIAEWIEDTLKANDALKAVQS